MMRNVLVLAGMSVLLSGCLTNEKGERLGRSEFYRTTEKAQSLGLLTPTIAEECSVHVVKLFKNTRIVGPFSISTTAAIRGAEYQASFLPDHSADNTVAVVAPVDSDTLIGSELHSMAGCLYRLQDNRLVFEKAKSFGIRIDVTRVAPHRVRRDPE